MTSIKINDTCHKARHSHEGPGENTKNLIMYIGPETIVTLSHYLTIH